MRKKVRIIKSDIPIVLTNPNSISSNASWILVRDVIHFGFDSVKRYRERKLIKYEAIRLADARFELGDFSDEEFTEEEWTTKSLLNPNENSKSVTNPVYNPPKNEEKYQSVGDN